MPVLSGGVIPAAGEVVCEEMYFAQAANNTGGTYTASVTVPADSWLIDIIVYGQALWNSVTSAVLKIGDASTTDGYYVGVDLKATDLLVDETLSFDNPGGKEGAYIVSATGLRNKMWASTERVITGVVTEATTTVAAAGKTRVLVVYSTTSNAGNAVFA